MSSNTVLCLVKAYNPELGDTRYPISNSSTPPPISQVLSFVKSPNQTKPSSASAVVYLNNVGQYAGAFVAHYPAEGGHPEMVVAFLYNPTVASVAPPSGASTGGTFYTFLTQRYNYSARVHAVTNDPSGVYSFTSAESDAFANPVTFDTTGTALSVELGTGPGSPEQALIWPITGASNTLYDGQIDTNSTAKEFKQFQDAISGLMTAGVDHTVPFDPFPPGELPVEPSSSSKWEWTHYAAIIGGPLILILALYTWRKNKTTSLKESGG